MLVLTRRLNQSIRIGDDIEITIIEVSGDQVRLGIAAPRTTSVHRTEVYEQIQQQNRAAAVSIAPPSTIGKTLAEIRAVAGRDCRQELQSL